MARIQRTRHQQVVVRMLREILDCPSGRPPSVDQIVRSGGSRRDIDRKLTAREALIKLEKRGWKPRSQQISPRIEKPAPKGRWLYRLWSADDQLLYVGITDRGHRREREHARTKAWWPEVHHVTYERVAARAELLYRERVAIERERPRYNVQHNTRR